MTITVTYTCATPAQPSAISGATTTCPGATQSYSVTNVTGVTYNWALPSGWSQTGGGTTNSITVTTDTGSGNISVTPSNGCGSGTARTLAVTVRPVFTTGTISSTGQTICYAGTPSVIGSTTAASGGDGTITYSWRSSADGYTAAIGGATSATYTPPAGLTTTTSYRRYAHDGTCNTTATVSTGTWTVTVRPQFTTGTISTTGQTICYAGTPTVIGSTTAASGGDGAITYSWRSSTDGYTAAIGGATSSTYTPPAGLTTTTSYRRYAHDGTCNTTATASIGTWTVTVDNPFTSGAIETTGETICYDGDPSAIGSATDASGGDGSIAYQWQADGVDIPGANSASYDPPSGLTTTTTYTRYAYDGTCNTTPELSAGSWIVTVNQTIVVANNGISTDVTCSGGSDGSITLGTVSGGDGNYAISWTGPGGYTGSGVTITGLAAGTYSYSVTDGILHACHRECGGWRTSSNNSSQ